VHWIWSSSQAFSGLKEVMIMMYRARMNQPIKEVWKLYTRLWHIL